MAKNIGEIIKALRKERNLTQEELSELLNVTGQAVSKWENGTSMPDISQIVPLAKVFGVSTDVLFDTFGTNDDDEVLKIIDAAQKQTYDAAGGYTKESLYAAYLMTQDGLKRYPNNMILLLYSLGKAMALSYPENDCYDEAHAQELYTESICQANIVISYGKNANDILHAHMLMVLFHSINGNMSKAREHAEQFPLRTDYSYYNMNAYISHAERNYTLETLLRQKDCHFHLEAMLDNMMLNGKALLSSGRYSDALTAFGTAIDLIKLYFKGEKYLSPMFIRDCGDVHALIAETYLKTGDTENAVIWLEKEVEYELVTRESFDGSMTVHSPLLPNEEGTFYFKGKSRGGRARSLYELLTDDVFAALSTNEKYQALLCRVSAEINKE